MHPRHKYHQDDDHGHGGETDAPIHIHGRRVSISRRTRSILLWLIFWILNSSLVVVTRHGLSQGNMSCLRCKKRSQERLFTLSGCRQVCYICERCYEDRKLSDEDLLTSISLACGKCLPLLAADLARRSCVYCRRYGKTALMCDCADGHYVCQECARSTKNGAKILKDLHAKKIPQPFGGTAPSPADVDPGVRSVIRTRPPRKKKQPLAANPVSVVEEKKTPTTSADSVSVEEAAGAIKNSSPARPLLVKPIPLRPGPKRPDPVERKA